MSSWTWFHRLASPPSFYRLADRLDPAPQERDWT